MNKKTLYIVIISGFILIAFGAWMYLSNNRNLSPKPDTDSSQNNQNNNQEPSFSTSTVPASGGQNGIISQIDRHLTAEERKKVENNLAINKELLAGMPKETSNSQLYKLHMEIGHQLFALGELAKARNEYLIAAKLMPLAYTSQTALFAVYLEMKDIASAGIAIKKAVDLAPDKPDTWRKYIAFKQQQLDASNKEIGVLYQEALLKTNNNIDIVVLYARFLGQTGDYAKAINFWQMAISINSNMKDIYNQEIRSLEEKIK